MENISYVGKTEEQLSVTMGEHIHKGALRSLIQTSQTAVNHSNSESAVAWPLLSTREHIDINRDLRINFSFSSY